ncbi:putative TIM-barrel fold metal-dependent hydrolase [Streptosporangium album]|uniref:Putative TIM-barrel fold metal-dependent hydrolase n=1 Tax=Streptosporangium album TaxID=47479 RepID=A0A7W7S5E5_9ACTN|nr:amidohydrolase family protein [Streptosporangium album]MBB4944194.1 putative TIM-barrel fold metal-dependent hydrolase [Streptosporangium album]
MTSPQTLNLDWLISVDDHVIEPGHVWTDRVPAKYKDVAPRLIKDNEGEAWVYENRRVPSTGLAASAGRRKEEFTPNPIPYSEMRAGCYDSVARLEDMNRSGILASMCFPSVPRFCGQLFWEAQDKELALLCVQAYNDFMIDEWCGSAPGRYIPLVIVPLWDPRAAAKEVERTAAKGARAVAFSENPAPLGLPTIHDPQRYWDPLFAAAQEAELVVCMHVGSSSTMPKISPISPFMANMAWGATRTSGAMLEWLFSGVFSRFPGLKIALSEGSIGWIPYFLERAEQVIENQRGWVLRGESFGGSLEGAHESGSLDLATFDIRQTYLDHVFGCFIDDIHGLRNLDVIGEDNVMIETDYPHSDSTWPDCMKLARERLAGLAPEVQYKILRGNAERVFRFTPAAPPSVTR